jgi:hypothetical protein
VRSSTFEMSILRLSRRASDAYPRQLFHWAASTLFHTSFRGKW